MEANQTIERNAERRSMVLGGILVVLLVFGLLASSFVHLSTPVIDHVISGQSIRWRRWLSGTGDAVFGAVLLLYFLQVILHRGVNNTSTSQSVVPNLRERAGMVLYDATFEMGLLYGALSVGLWASAHLLGDPDVAVGLVAALVLSITVHLWALSRLQNIQGRMLWSVVFGQVIAVVVFGTLTLRDGLEAGVFARAVTATLFLWPRRGRSGGEAR